MQSITFSEIIDELNVSEATLRNWVSTGSLALLKPKVVTFESYYDFKENIIGKEKLIGRANKLRCDFTDIKKITQNIQHILSSLDGEDKIIATDAVAGEYEEQLGLAYKNLEGVFYTPGHIVKKMFQDIPIKDFHNIKFCDPCCGTGNFIVGAIECGVSPENIVGYDIDPIAVDLAKARIRARTGMEIAIYQKDFLGDECQIENKNRFDVIITNPPWGKKLSSKDKHEYAQRFNEGQKVDTSGLFALACLESLKVDGYLSLLLPEAFFNITAFQTVRRSLLGQTVLNLSDYGKPFVGLQTRAQSFLLQKTSNTSSAKVLCRFEGKQFYRYQDEFYSNPNTIMNFYASDRDAEVIRKIFEKPHITLANNARWGLGVVTGNNKKHLKNSLLPEHVPVLKGSDVQKGSFSEAKFFIPNDFGLFQQTAPRDIYDAKKKMVYRFINSKLIFSVDTQQRYFLNSANMFVLSDSFPISYEQLEFLFNTKLMSWLFSKVFRTHKILRSDLEKLPIFFEFFSQNCSYTEHQLYDYLGVKEEKNGTFRVKK